MPAFLFLYATTDYEAVPSATVFIFISAAGGTPLFARGVIFSFVLSGTFVASTVMDNLIDWFYGQIVGFLGNFFSAMGNMGVEIF